MAKYLFGDLVREVKEKVDRNNNPYEYYIAGDHMDTDELHLLRRGIFEGSDVGPAFIRIFKPGQVLYGSRRTYLRKVAVADFEGITANTTFVLESKDESILLQRLLPFIMQSERFVQYSIKRSKGSTNPYVLFSDLADYEVELPNIETQKELAELLWAMDSVKMSYNKLITATDELVKSQFIEMFGDPIKNPLGWPTMTLEQATEDIVSGQCLNGDAGQLQPGQKAVLKVSAVTYGVFDANEYKVLRDIKQIVKGIYPQKGDLLFSRANTREYVGATALIDQDYPDLMLPDKLWKLIFKQEIMPVFAKQFLSHPEVRKVLSAMATGTSGSMYNISMEKLKRLEIIVPNMNRQKEYIRFVDQSDKSKFAVQSCSNLNLWSSLECGIAFRKAGRK